MNSLKTDYDFCGWATKNNLKCSDGRTIRKDAFIVNDNQEVPLVWNHQHNDIQDVLGHALLENREEGVFAYGKFNDSENGQIAKTAVQNGDIKALSIYANQLKQNGGDVLHGVIREVSLVLAGANPGATIEAVLSHGEDTDSEAVICVGEELGEFKLFHAEESKQEPEKKEPEKKEDNKTVADVIDGMSEEQQKVLYYLVNEAHKTSESEGGKETMKHNAFDSNYENDVTVLSHSDEQAIINDARKNGSLKASVLAHTQEYGIENIGLLWENDYNTLDKEPSFIKRETGWVAKVMAAKHTPFSRIRSIHANITEDDARARGYIKSHQKKAEVFPLLKRTTDPTTVYKLQKLDRDDMLDITDFNVVAFLKKEMRVMLEEEIARAALVGDGREAGTEYKISEDHIRPIWKDNDLYSVKELIEFAKGTDESARAKAFIKKCIKARKNYKGSGSPSLFTTEDLLTDMLLLEDGMGRPLYDTEEKLRTALRVKEIVTVPVMEGLTRTLSSGTHSGAEVDLMGIIVNMSDYNFGNDKGGEISMFDDFDINFNQYEYLMETRLSGALTVPFSAIVIEAYQGE